MFHTHTSTSKAIYYTHSHIGDFVNLCYSAEQMTQHDLVCASCATTFSFQCARPFVNCVQQSEFVVEVMYMGVCVCVCLLIMLIALILSLNFIEYLQKRFRIAYTNRIPLMHMHFDVFKVLCFAMRKNTDHSTPLDHLQAIWGFLLATYFTLDNRNLENSFIVFALTAMVNDFVTLISE